MSPPTVQICHNVGSFPGAGGGIKKRYVVTHFWPSILQEMLWSIWGFSIIKDQNWRSTHRVVVTAIKKESVLFLSGS